MYTDHFSLNNKPFQTTTDPRFLWLGEKHKHVLVSLRYGLMDNPGIMLLTGEVGTGKTLLVNYLKSVLEKDILIASFVDPDLPTIDFYNLLAYEFNWQQVFASKGKFLLQLCNFLYECHANKQRVLLVIDESQRLNQRLIEDIRLLSNIELNNQKLINIFFVGQQECKDILLRPQNTALTRRIAVHCHIESLDERETGLYINHRLKVAGSAYPIFNNAAVREMYRVSSGLPRLINVISDQCLLTAYVQGAKHVDDSIVKACAHELQIPEYKPKENSGTLRIASASMNQKKSIPSKVPKKSISVPSKVPKKSISVHYGRLDTHHYKAQPPKPKSSITFWIAHAVVFVLLILGLFYLYGEYDGGIS